MAGGKGKSGGKSSGGKTGADGSKKQQSHSAKAGLQVSDPRLRHTGAFLHGFEMWFGGRESLRWCRIPRQKSRQTITNNTENGIMAMFSDEMDTR
jgi:hypothetical protein